MYTPKILNGLLIFCANNDGSSDKSYTKIEPAIKNAIQIVSKPMT